MDGQELTCESCHGGTVTYQGPVTRYRDPTTPTGRALGMKSSRQGGGLEQLDEVP